MNFNNLQEIANYLYDNSNELKSYITVEDIVDELAEIVIEVYNICDDYMDIKTHVNSNILNNTIEDIVYTENEEVIDYIIEAAENILRALQIKHHQEN